MNAPQENQLKKVYVADIDNRWIVEICGAGEVMVNKPLISVDDLTVVGTENGEALARGEGCRLD